MTPGTNMYTAPPPAPAPTPVGVRPPAPGDPRPMPARQLWMILGSVLLLGGIFWGTLSVVEVLAHEEWTTTHQQPAAGLTTLDLDVETGRVEIRGGDTDTIVVEADVSRGLFGVTEEATVVDDQYRVRAACPELGSTWCRVDYVVTVPSGLAVNVRVDNGSVVVNGVSGPLTIDSDNGRVDLADIGGELTVNGDNGRVEGTGLRAGTVSVQSDNGRVRLGFAEPPDSVLVRTDNGSIELTVPDVGYAIDAHTNDGRQDIAVVSDPSADRTLDLRAENGHISVLAPTDTVG